MTIADLLGRIMKSDIKVQDRVKIKIGDFEYDVIDLVAENGTVFIRFDGLRFHSMK